MTTPSPTPPHIALLATKALQEIREIDCRSGIFMPSKEELRLTAITRALLEAAAGGWQPIETAPKDGTAVLGFFPTLKGFASRQDVQPINWSGWGGGVWACFGDRSARWIPLPSLAGV